jgi:hypothetical protein
VDTPNASRPARPAEGGLRQGDIPLTVSRRPSADDPRRGV